MLTRVAKLEIRVTAEKSAMSAISRVLSNDCNRSEQNLERNTAPGNKARGRVKVETDQVNKQESERVHGDLRQQSIQGPF